MKHLDTVNSAKVKTLTDFVRQVIKDLRCCFETLIPTKRRKKRDKSTRNISTNSWKVSLGISIP